MRTALDVVRSVQRYTASMLAAPWDVRIALENETPQRPFVLVTQNGPDTTIGQFGGHSVRRQISVTVHCYLEEADDRASAETAAAGIEETLFMGFRAWGVAPAVRGGLVPLWDFVNDTTGGVNPPRQPPDYAMVRAWATRTLPDAANPRRMMVVADMQLAWWRAGAVADPGHTPWTQIRAHPLVP